MPVNHFRGVPSLIRSRFGLPIIYYEGDMPTILPEMATERGFKFSHYEGADLDEYDSFIGNSKGVEDRLRQMGAHNMHTIYYAADPSVYDVRRDTASALGFDVFYYGHGSRLREDRLEFMVAEPSRRLSGVHFHVAGRGFETDLGNASKEGELSLAQWIARAQVSKINLNVTRGAHARIFASSTSRLFELAAMGCCIVSDPYLGIEEWFEVGKEVFVVSNASEAVDIYKTLLASEPARRQVAERAHARVLAEHTFEQRAEQLLDIIRDTLGDKAA